jgi:hypothetical protein
MRVPSHDPAVVHPLPNRLALRLWRHETFRNRAVIPPVRLPALPEVDDTLNYSTDVLFFRVQMSRHLARYCVYGGVLDA